MQSIPPEARPRAVSTLVDDSSSTGPVALELRDVSKSFLGVDALKDVSLTCRVGELHALVGENGAGKSTLIKIASGVLKPDSGSVRIGGEAVTHQSALAVRRLGLLTAYQDTSLVAGLTVAENVVLSFHGVRETGLRTDLALAEDLLRRFDLPFEGRTPVAELSPASRQLLEVVRALVHRPKVLLLDEPTAALDLESSRQLEQLLNAAKQHSAIVYISHRLDEVRRMADRLSVLRDGCLVGTWDGRGWNVDDIVRHMVGVPTDVAFPSREHRTTGPVVVETREYAGEGFGPISLQARAGEIIGIAGSEGNGQRPLLRGIAGLTRTRGDLIVEGAAVSSGSPTGAVKAGITFLSGDRAEESVFDHLSVMENTTLTAKGDLGPLGLVLRSRERAVFEPAADALGIVRSSPDQPIRELSGGNQQKAVLARAELMPTQVLVIDEPTQGVDVRARLDIYRMLVGYAERGATLVVNSSDAEELAGICDRVYVMSRGRVVKELQGDELTGRNIVESFVDGSAHSGQREGSKPDTTVANRRGSRFFGSSVLPIAGLLGLMIAVGAYASSQSEVFLTTGNLTNLLILTLPLAIVALGQQVCLLCAEFDISIGSTISLTVVALSFVATGDSAGSTIPGLLFVLLMGLVIGLINAFIVRNLKVNAIIATISTMGILAGLALILRPQPGGLISLGLADVLAVQVGFVPVAFVVVVLAALAAEFWRSATFSGLSFRATGLDEEAATRTGIRVGRTKTLGYVVAAVSAVVAGIVLATQVGQGSSTVGVNFPLVAFTACFLGGAALTGGKGNFIGTLLGALFLSMLINVTPLVNLPEGLGLVVTGVLTILAVAAYSFAATARRPTRTPLGSTGDAALSSGVNHV